MSPFRVKNREILVARPRYRALSENHEILWDPSRFFFPTLPLASFYHSNHSMRVENYFTSALARLLQQWVLKIFIFWTRFIRSSGRSKRRPLNLLKGDNGSDGTMGFDFEVKRPGRHILGSSSCLSARPRHAFPGTRRRSNFLICLEHAAGCDRWFSDSVKLPSTTCMLRLTVFMLWILILNPWILYD